MSAAENMTPETARIYFRAYVATMDLCARIQQCDATTLPQLKEFVSKLLESLPRHLSPVIGDPRFALVEKAKL